MSTSDDAPVESTGESPYREEPRGVPDPGDWKIGPGEIVGGRQRRKLKAEMAHRVAIEPWGERSRRLPFPWGLALFVGGLFGLACLAAGWALSKAWWW